ncbi:transposase [Virgibacillus necropolis]|uniref:transposase n=1 Tax=Virgibacillus necropolis TaxID=163877 RepID=UPI001D047056|nr:transposase [Virgibacillus necropolis]
MEQTKTIKNKILSHGSTAFEPTLLVYRDALGFIVEVIEKEYSLLEGLLTKELTPAVEKFIHRTKNNPTSKYNFTSNFYKFPSYLRRSAISKGFGIVKSYRSNLQNWEDEKSKALAEGKFFKKKSPVLRVEHDAFPVLYKGNMFNRLSTDQAEVKIYKNNDWVWETITFNDKNLKNRGIMDWKENNPTLVKVGKKYFINFSYTKEIKLRKTKIIDQIIVSVDLGLTNSAVCSAMYSDGTVIGRKFINQPIEKDRMNTIIGKLKKAQRNSGTIEAPNYWKKINGLQNHIKVNTASEIIKFAETHNADVIVFEYLGKMHVPKGIFGAKKLRYKLHHWCKLEIQSKVEEMAHYRQMRIRRVNPKNTSKLAFDGSGEVKRIIKKTSLHLKVARPITQT